MCRAPQTQGFLAFQAAFAKPFSAPTASDLVGDALAGPNTFEAQRELFTTEMNEVSRLTTHRHRMLLCARGAAGAMWPSNPCAVCCSHCLTCGVCVPHRCCQCLPLWMT